MSRPTDTERGARIARDQAQAMLDAVSRRDDLFPVHLGRHELRLWQGILLAAECELEEQLYLRLSMREARA